MTINLQNIPNDPWVYIFKDEKDKVLYIGKAKNLQKRVTQYFSPGSLRKQEMLAKAEKLDFHIVKNESEALYLEDNMIKEYQPYYNNLLKADNSYVYIKITHEDFPQILITRKRLDDKATYIWPKHNTQSLKNFLHYLRQVLKFRGCKNTQFRQGKLCSDYYFGICSWRCTLAQSTKLKAKRPYPIPDLPAGRQGSQFPITNTPIHQYSDIIHSIVSFFKGNTKPIKDEIKSQINDAVQKNNFERAARLRDIFVEIEGLTEQQTVVLPEQTTGYLIQVKPVGQRRIAIILYFYEWKLIDIIRHKEHQNDKDQDEMIFDLQREFGTLHEQKIKEGALFSTMSFPPVKGGSPGKPWGGGFAKPLKELLDNLFQSYIINSSFDESNLINELLSTIQERYQLKHFPYRIECIDISHLSGWRVSGGLSCLLGGIKYPHGYRRYRIGWKLKVKSWKLQDDYMSLKELLERREKNGWEMPNLLILDGWKGQLGIIKKLCQENPKRKEILKEIDIISLWKWEARNKNKIWTSKIWKRPDRSENIQRPASSLSTTKVGIQHLDNKTITETIYSLDSKLSIHEQAMVYDSADKILLQARDEAHRFANAYRKKQMSKEWTTP